MNKLVILLPTDEQKMVDKFVEEWEKAIVFLPNYVKIIEINEENNVRIINE